MFYMSVGEAKMTDPQKADQSKLQLLWLGLGIYVLLMLFGLQFALTLPYPILGLAGLLNMAILFAFIFGIRRVYLRKHAQTSSGESEIDPVSSNSRDRRRLRWLWIGVIIALLTVVNGLVYIRQVPYQAALGISTLYIVIVVVFALEIRRVYKRLRQ